MNIAELKQAFASIFAQRGGPPSGALVRWATSEGRFLTAIARFSDERQEVRAARKYSRLTLEEEWLDTESAVERIAATVCDPPGASGYPFGKFYPPNGVGRRTPPYSSNLSEWCEWWIEARANDPRGSSVTAPSEVAVAHGLPPFDSCDRAIEDWLMGRVQQSSGNARYLGEFVMVVPDTRGLIDGVRWDGNTLRASTRGARDAADLELQAVVETEKGRVVLPSIRPAPPSHDWAVPDDARAAEVFLVHVTGDLMGMTRVTPGARVRPEEEALSVSEQAARDLANGENDRVEFKPFIERGDDKWWEVAKSIVAFANTFGGRLYVGVRNGGDPEGEKALDKALKENGDREKLFTAYLSYIDEQVRTRVKPTPLFKVTRASHFGQPIIVIAVESGTDKPYSTVSDEVLVRKGASNKRPDAQTELRQLFEARATAVNLLSSMVGFSGTPGNW